MLGQNFIQLDNPTSESLGGLGKQCAGFPHPTPARVSDPIDPERVLRTHIFELVPE